MIKKFLTPTKKRESLWMKQEEKELSTTGR